MMHLNAISDGGESLIRRNLQKEKGTGRPSCSLLTHLLTHLPTHSLTHLLHTDLLTAYLQKERVAEVVRHVHARVAVKVSDMDQLVLGTN